MTKWLPRKKKKRKSRRKKMKKLQLNVKRKRGKMTLESTMSNC